MRIATLVSQGPDTYARVAHVSVCVVNALSRTSTERLKNYQEHTFVEIPSQFWHNAKHPVINCRGESLEDWIRRLTLQVSKSSVKLVERGNCGPEQTRSPVSVTLCRCLRGRSPHESLKVAKFIEESSAFEKLHKDFQNFVMPQFQSNTEIGRAAFFEVSSGHVPPPTVNILRKSYQNILQFLSAIGLREGNIPPGHWRIRWTNVGD